MLLQVRVILLSFDDCLDKNDRDSTNLKTCPGNRPEDIWLQPGDKPPLHFLVAPIPGKQSEKLYGELDEFAEQSL